MPSAGLEPATCRLGSECSIRLSYESVGVRHRTRTCNRQLRRLVLYPIELGEHTIFTYPTRIGLARPSTFVLRPSLSGLDLETQLYKISLVTQRVCDPKVF